MWAANSIAIALLAAGFVVLSGALVAFGSAYFRFPGRKVLFGLVLATMMLPGAVTMVPQYLIWLNLGLVGTWVPLFGANLFGSAFYIFRNGSSSSVCRGSCSRRPGSTARAIWDCLAGSRSRCRCLRW